METVVLKFGGTSVSTMERRMLAVNKIEQAINNGLFPVVVVSAIGRKGDPYATDTLVNFVRTSTNTSTTIYPNANVSPHTDADVEANADTNADADSGEANEDINNRDLDLLLSCGEIISSVFLSDMLNKLGHKSAALTGWQAGIITDSNFGNADILKVNTGYLQNCIENNIIPVIAGFQGMSESGEITTLGRGGSDITASIIGEALNASAVEIYTDVDGVMTADPKVQSDAKFIPRISYNEMYRMAELGAKVLHPASVKIAARCDIPLYVKNTMSDSPGTLVTNCYDGL